MLSYDLFTKKELIERLIILEDELIAFRIRKWEEDFSYHLTTKNLERQNEMDKCKR